MNRIFIIFLLMLSNANAGSLDCPCKVVKVTDGDTVHVLDQTITNLNISYKKRQSP